MAVVGAGGLGCPALQYLAAAGVGEPFFFHFSTSAQTDYPTIQAALGSSTMTSSKYQTSNARRFTRNLGWEHPRRSLLPLRSKSSVVTPFSVPPFHIPCVA